MSHCLFVEDIIAIGTLIIDLYKNVIKRVISVSAWITHYTLLRH